MVGEKETQLDILLMKPKVRNSFHTKKSCTECSKAPTLETSSLHKWNIKVFHSVIIYLLNVIRFWKLEKKSCWRRLFFCFSSIAVRFVFNKTGPGFILRKYIVSKVKLEVCSFSLQIYVMKKYIYTFFLFFFPISFQKWLTNKMWSVWRPTCTKPPTAWWNTPG